MDLMKQIECLCVRYRFWNMLLKCGTSDFSEERNPNRIIVSRVVACVEPHRTN